MIGFSIILCVIHTKDFPNIFLLSLLSLFFLIEFARLHDFNLCGNGPQIFLSDSGLPLEHYLALFGLYTSF